MNRSEKQNQTRTLLVWINHLLKTELKELVQLWSGEIIHKVIGRVPGIDSKPYRDNPCNTWQLAFTNNKTTYRSIEVYWAKILKKSFRSHSYIDLLKLSKERNQEQIMQLSLLALGCAIQSQNKDQFMEPIFGFNQSEYADFVALLQKYKFDDEPLSDNKVIQIKDLMTKVEVLNIQNDNLEKAMDDQLMELQLLQQSVNYLTEQNKKTKEELKASLSLSTLPGTLTESVTVGVPQKTLATKSIQGARNSIEDTKKISQLKARIHEEKQSHLREINDLKETVQFLKQTISGNRKQRGVSSRRMSKGITPRAESDHPPCVSLVKYQQVVFSQTQKIKELTRNQTDSQQTIAMLRMEITQLKNKTKKGDAPNVASEGDSSLNDSEYSKIRHTILEGIRDGLVYYSTRKV